MALRDDLERIFDADRAMRKAETSLLRKRRAKALVDVLVDATREALATQDHDEATMRLERLADLCAQVPGPEMTDALIAILNHDEPRVRVAAGEALRDVGFERYAEVARGIERALDRGDAGPAMSELPWVLAEIAEPSALPLIRRFLVHPEADVVAASIEALSQLGEPEAVADLQRFVDDTRIVTVEDFEDETKTTLGELAKEALVELGFDETS
jgi:HEAT repeat protein